MLFDIFLADQHERSVAGDIFEIGVAQGKSAFMLALHQQPGETLIVNDIDAASLNKVVPQLAAVNGGTMRALTQFSQDLKPADISERPIRFIHIDGDHGHLALRRDLALADQLLSEDGLLVLDDFLAPSFVGLAVAAIEWLALNPGRLALFLAGSRKGYLCRPSHRPHYLAFMRDRMPAELRSRGHTDFSFWFWKTDEADDFNGFGMTNRQWDRDFITADTDPGSSVQGARRPRLRRRCTALITRPARPCAVAQ